MIAPKLLDFAPLNRTPSETINSGKTSGEVHGIGKRWLRSLIPVAILGCAALIFSSYESSDLAILEFPDGLHDFLAPLAFSAGVNPYDKAALTRFSVSEKARSITRLPRNPPPGPFVSTPINLILYRPFAWERDYYLYLRTYFAVYFLGFAGSFFLLTWRKGAVPWKQAIATVFGTALLFIISGEIQFSLYLGQIEYLYIFFMALGVFLFRESLRTSDGMSLAILAGAAMALSGQIKTFPYVVGMALVGAAIKNWLWGPEERDLRRPLYVAAISVVLSSILLLLVTSFYTGIHGWVDWIRGYRASQARVLFSTVSLGQFIVRAHSLWSGVYLTSTAGGKRLLYAAYLISVAVMVRFSCFGKRKFSDIELCGVICLAPSVLPTFKPYYLTFLAIPFLNVWPYLTRALSGKPKWILPVSFAGLTLVFMLAQAPFGFPRPFQHFDLPRVHSRTSGTTGSQDFAAYSATVVLFGVYWWLQKVMPAATARMSSRVQASGSMS